MWKLKSKDHKILHLSPSALSFSIFTQDEIKSLSEVKVTTPLSFNALGHPLKGGLYDPALGAYICQNVERSTW
jgi:DNA-directed RNA polymerase I subunit RPA1